MSEREIDLVRTAYEMRDSGAHRRAAAAVIRARAAGDIETADEIDRIARAHRHIRLRDQALGGPTAETVVHARRRPHGDTIQALLQTGALTVDEARAAIEIGRIVEALVRRVSCRCGSYEPRTAGSASSDLSMPSALAWRYEQRYLPWARWMQRHGHARHLQLVLSICVDGRSVRDAAAAYAMRRSSVVRILAGALGRYVMICDGHRDMSCAWLAGPATTY